MIYIIPVIYVFINIVHAVWHWHLITQFDKTIKSTQKVIEYGVLCLAAFFLLLPYSNWLPLIIFPVLTRAAFFDALLNALRGKNLFYDGVISKKKSWVDYIEDKIGLPQWFFKLIYLFAYITYLIIYLNGNNT